MRAYRENTFLMHGLEAKIGRPFSLPPILNFNTLCRQWETCIVYGPSPVPWGRGVGPCFPWGHICWTLAFFFKKRFYDGSKELSWILKQNLKQKQLFPNKYKIYLQYWFKQTNSRMAIGLILGFGGTWKVTEFSIDTDSANRILL